MHTHTAGSGLARRGVRQVGGPGGSGGEQDPYFGLNFRGAKGPGHARGSIAALQEPQHQQHQHQRHGRVGGGWEWSGMSCGGGGGGGGGGTLSGQVSGFGSGGGNNGRAGLHAGLPPLNLAVQQHHLQQHDENNLHHKLQVGAGVWGCVSGGGGGGSCLCEGLHL